MQQFKWVSHCFAAALLAIAGGAWGQFERNTSAPEIEAVDIHGQRVSLADLIAREPYLVIVHFFTTDDGEEVALELRDLHKRYGDKRLGIIALGLKEDEAALRQFAESLDIDYYIVEESSLDNPDYLGKVTTLPLTLFVLSDPNRTIERVISGGGESRAILLRELAENLYRQNRPEALEVAEKVVTETPEDRDARELKGFILLSQGRLDDADAEFGAIDSKAGQAAVALEKGDADTAIRIAGDSNEPYAKTVSAQALLQQGKVDEAESLLKAGAPEGRPWMQSETLNLQGRVDHAQGELDGAIVQYDKAVDLDPLNIVALSNEAEAYRARGEEGDLQKAQETLQQAQAVGGDDEMVRVMLQQILAEQRHANNIDRRNLIQRQIAELKLRYEALETGETRGDDWSSRPLVLALLPGNSQTTLLERAGTPTVIQRELEGRLNNDSRITVVEREMLDALLQELDLGSSDLASADTQRRLGKVISAGLLGFIEYARLGKDLMVYLRLVDTETTGIQFQASNVVDESKPLATVEALLSDVVEELTRDQELKGLIADAALDDAVIINIGSKHGVSAGQEFVVIDDGEPIEAGGRVIGHRQRPVARLTIDSVEPEYAVGHITSKSEELLLRPDMKVKALVD